MKLVCVRLTDLSDSSGYFAAVYFVLQGSHCDNLIGDNESKRKAVAMLFVDGGKAKVSVNPK